MQKEYYSVKEVAQKLGYEPITIYRYVWWGDIKAYKIGKEYRVADSELERFMVSCRYQSPYEEVVW